MTVVAVEDDRVLRLVQVALDPAAPAERVAAFADFVSHDVPDFAGWLAGVRAELPRLFPAQVRMVDDTAALRRALPDARVAIVESLPIGAAELACAQRLAAVQKFGMVDDAIDRSACAVRGVAVRTLRRRTNVSLAEHTMMFVLALARRLPRIAGAVTVERLRHAGFTPRPYDTRHTAAANFGRVPDLRMLRGRTLGLLGIGEIGREVARLAAAFGMTVLAHRRRPIDAATAAALGVEPCGFDALLARSEFLSVHVPMSGDTRGLLGRAELARMPAGSCLVNTARAAIVDRTALIEALDRGHLAGVAMDVLYDEPDVDDDPLLDRPDVLLTPHLAGASRANGLADLREMLTGLDAALAGQG